MAISGIYRMHTPTRGGLMIFHQHSITHNDDGDYAHETSVRHTWKPKEEYTGKQVIDTINEVLDISVLTLGKWLHDEPTMINYMHYLSRYYSDGDQSTGVIGIVYAPRDVIPFLPLDDNTVSIRFSNPDGFDMLFLTFIKPPSEEYIDKIITAACECENVRYIDVSDELAPYLKPRNDPDQYVDFTFTRNRFSKVHDNNFISSLSASIPITTQVNLEDGYTHMTSLYSGNWVRIEDDAVKVRLYLYEKRFVSAVNWVVDALDHIVHEDAETARYREWVKSNKPK